VAWEDNASVEALKALATEGLTIEMSMYGGFEQVGSIGQSLPRSDAQTTTASGDIVLYSGNQLVVFYGSNSWAYTRLGHITDQTPAQMKALLDAYNAKREVTIQVIIAFHAEFEKIHPFQDGNGRVGRLIALKECLRFNIVPFLIEDSKKAFYYRGLSEWDNEKGWLTDTCLDGQDTFKRLLAMFDL
jgi:hypothetical protein